MKVLIVDDSVDFTSTIADIIKSFGIEADCINSPEEAITYLEKNHESIGLILLDIEFGFGAKMNGLDLLDIFQRDYISIPVVMISGKGTIEVAVKATKLGAVNFIEKNIITKEKIRGVVDATINQKRVRGEISEIQNFLAANGIVGKSLAITEVGENIVKYGRTDLNVLITGETGTGKKLIAKAIHAISKRVRANFVPIDISNISKDLFQSELFGYAKGTTSNESKDKQGLFHLADKGTIFFNEVAGIPFDLQANLIAPIEDQVIRKVGATESENIDVRFIATTNRDLLEMIKTDMFREQLYYGLRECEIVVPSLKSRVEDIPHIINHCTAVHNVEFKDSKHFTPSAIEYLAEHKWPGNVRELLSLVKVLLQTTPNPEIEAADAIKTISNSNLYMKVVSDGLHSISGSKTLKEDLAEVDKIKIEKTLSQTNGNVSKSAAILGISRETLHNKIRKYEINTQQFRNKDL